MAVATPTTLTSGTKTVDATTATTASVTVTAGRLYMFTVVSKTEISTDPNQPTITGNGLTVAQVPTNGTQVIDSTSSSRRRHTLLWAYCASTSTGTFTIDFGGQTQVTSGWAIDEIASGFFSTTPIVQAAKNLSLTAVTSITATLGAFSSTLNATYGSFGVSNGTNNPTAGSGFATVTSVQDSVEGNLGLETEFRVDNDTTVDFTFSSDSELGVIGCEIRAAIYPRSNLLLVKQAINRANSF